jgi:hypothetical protein
MRVASASCRKPGGFCNDGKQSGKGETMRPPSRLGLKTAVFGVALLLAATPGARAAGPAAPPAVPQINKTTVYNGAVPTVSYSVQGGSPHLQALAHALQFTENEMTVTTELQQLRLGIVHNEQTLDAVRTSQLLGLGPMSTPGYACYTPPDSALKTALVPGLAREANPAKAYELINLWEQLQTEVQAEQANAAGVVRAEAPAGQDAQPVAAVAGPVPAPQPEAPVAAPAAAPQLVVQQPALPAIRFGGPASAQQIPTPVRFGTRAGPQRFPPPLQPQQALAFQQMVRQRILDAQQQQRMSLQQ